MIKITRIDFRRVPGNNGFSDDFITNLKNEISYEDALVGFAETTIELDEIEKQKEKAITYIKECQNSGLLFSRIIYKELLEILGVDK